MRTTSIAVAAAVMALALAGCDRLADVEASDIGASPLASFTADGSGREALEDALEDKAGNVGTHVPTGDGALSLTMTAPRDLTVETSAAVDCSVDGRVYSASTSAQGDAGSATFSLTAARYQGAGDYALVGTLEVVADGETTTVPVAAQGTIADDLSGSVTIDAENVSVTLGWTCG